MPRKKLTPLPKLYKKADKVVSNFVRQLEEGKCYTCGNIKEWKYQHAGHYIKRSCWQLRWDIRNVHCQCPACNTYRGGNMDVYAVKLLRQYGDDILFEFDEILKDSRANPKKPTREYIENTIKLYNSKTKV